MQLTGRKIEVATNTRLASQVSYPGREESTFSGIPCLKGMKRVPLNGILLAVVVVLHLGVTAAHAMAHVLAQVTLSRLALSFVLTIVLIGPLMGLIMQRTIYPRGGAWVIAGTLAAAFYFGLASHFFILGPDHVTQVTEAWRGLFETTAVLLALIEFFGSGVAVWCATREGKHS